MKHKMNRSRVNKVLSFTLAAALLASSGLSGSTSAAFASASEDMDTIHVETSVPDTESITVEENDDISVSAAEGDGITVQEAGDGIEIQPAETKLGASVSVPDSGITIEGEDKRKAGNDVTLEIEAFNKLEEGAAFKLYFWDYPEQDLEQQTEQQYWKKALTNPCTDITVKDLDAHSSMQVELEKDGEAVQETAKLVQEIAEGGEDQSLSSRYLGLDLPAGSSTAFDVVLNKKDAGHVAVVPAIETESGENWYDVVCLTWEEDTIVIDEVTDIVIEQDDSIVIENPEDPIVVGHPEDSIAVDQEEQVTEDNESGGSGSIEADVQAEKNDTETGSIELDTETNVTEETDSEAGAALENQESGTVKNEEADAPDTEDSVVVDAEEETEEAETQDVETEETETEEVDAGETGSETAEHFTETAEGTEELDAAHFASARLVVLAEDPDVIIDPEHVLAQYDTIYLLQYDSAEQAMNAYVYYEAYADAVEPDAVVEMASEVLSDADIEMDITEEQNPVAALAEESDSTVARKTDRVIALIDTGASEGPNIIDRVSLIDDVLEGSNSHANDMVAAIVSQNPDAKILSIRALGNDGYGSVSAVVSAIEYAINSNVDIINLSMYSKKTLSTSVLEAEIGKALDAGILVVGSAGNDGADVDDYVPGSINGVWTIGSVNASGVRQEISNYGDLVDYYVVSESTSEAAAKFSGYISLYGIAAASTDDTGLIYQEASEGSYENTDIEVWEEDPDTTKEDDTIYDPVIEKYVKEHADPAYVGEGELKLVNLMDVDATIAAEEDLDPGETIDTLMANNSGFRFLTQQTGWVPVYQFDMESRYVVAFADVMHNDKRATIIDSTVAHNDVYGVTVDGCHFDTDTGLLYIPISAFYGEDGTYYFQYLQTQILYSISGFDMESQWNSAALTVTEQSDGDIESNMSGGNIFLQGMSVQVGKYMDVNSMLVTVNGFPIEGELYAYDSDTGILTIGFSPAVVQSVWVQAEKSEDAPDVEPGLKAAYGAPIGNTAYSFKDMEAVAATIASADFEKIKVGYHIKCPASIHYPEGSGSHTALNAGGTRVYAYRCSNNYTNMAALTSYIVYGSGSANTILNGGKVYSVPTDAIYPFALKIGSLDDPAIDFDAFDYNLHLLLECSHTDVSIGSSIYTSAWRTGNVELRCVAVDKADKKPWAVFAIYTTKCAGQHGLGLFKIFIKPETGGVRITKRLSNAEMSSMSDRIYIDTTFGIYKDKACTKLYTNASFNGKVPLKGKPTDYKVSKTVTGMPPGIYYLKELGRNPGCIQNQRVYRFTVSEGKTTTEYVDIATGNSYTYVLNSAFRGRFNIYKKDSDTLKPLAGAVFKIKYYSKDRTSTTQKPDATWYFQSGDGENGTKKGMVNYTESYYLESWTNPETGTVYESDEPITLNDGRWYLPLSYLYITEICAPEGYELDTTERKLEIKADAETQKVDGIWVNALCPPAVLDVDNRETNDERWRVRVNAKKVNKSLTGLEGAVFDIYNEETCTSEPLGKITSGADGMTDILTIEVPATKKEITLYCKERIAPGGYTPTEEIFSLTFTKEKYDELFAAGDDTGELKTFGPTEGIVNEEGWQVRVNAKKVKKDLSGLAGAVFGVYKDPACSDEAGTLTSGSDGMTDILTVGVPMTEDEIVLYCREKTAPDGYKPSNELFSLTFTKAKYDELKAAGDDTGELKTFGPTEGIVNEEGETPTPTPTPPPDTPSSAGVYVKKTSAAAEEVLDLDSYSLGGAVFEVTSNKGFSGTLTTYENGVSNSLALPDDSWWEYPDPVKDKDGNVLYTPDPILHPVTTTYYVREVTAPKGHKLYTGTKSFTVTMPYDKEATFCVEFEDEPKFCNNSLDIEKLGVKGEKIQGAVFKVEYFDAASADESKLVKTWYLESDANGKITMDNAHVTSRMGFTSDEFIMHKGKIVLPIDGYLQLTEVAAPAEYIIDDTPVEFPTGETLEFKKRIYNDLEPCRVRLKKYATDGGTPLAGVEFELTFLEETFPPKADQSPHFQRLLKVGESIVRSTDASGAVSFDNLDQGKYQITEIKTAPGHTLLKEPIIVTLPMQMTDDEANSYGNVDFGSAKEDRSYTDMWFFYDCLYQITNTAKFTMPMSGGLGGWKLGFIGMGILAVTASGWFLYDTQIKRKRKRRKV